VKPRPIPDHCIPDGCRRYTIAPAPGDEEHVDPVEAVAGIVDQQVRMSVLVELEHGDLERLADVGAVWITMATTQLPPFAVTIADDRDWPQEADGAAS
jgi:hypothetical protein